MNIAVDGNNHFNTGWLTRFMNLPREAPGLDVLKEFDKKAFQEGWDMCDETSPLYRSIAFYRMLEMGLLRAFWVDDDNNEIE